MKKNTAPMIALSAQLIALSGVAPSEIKLLPAGQFKAKDGRPHGLPGWTLDDDTAVHLIAAAQAQTDSYLIDYEHQTLHSKTNGQPAPAAGWYTALEWRPNDGLYALNVEWTDNASRAIEAKEYRYISPVIHYDKKTGQITGLIMAALVNYPAIDGLTDLAAANLDLNVTLNPKETHMDTDDLLEQLRCVLNLPTLASSADIFAELGKLKLLLAQTGTTDGLSAALSRLIEKDAEITALSAQLNAPADPSKYVPVEAVTAMQTELAALSARVKQDDINKLIEPALADGRLLPAQKDWAHALGKSDLAALSTYLATAQPIAALQHTQTQGQAPSDTATTALSSEELQVAEQLGISHDDMINARGAK